jgi:hypothetical protein
MRDKKILEKLATHDVHNVLELFSLVNKCARAVEGHAWHSQSTLGAWKASKPIADAATQGSDKLLASAPTTTAAAAGGDHGPRGDKRLCQSSDNDKGGQWCPLHNSKCHNAEECREI